MGLYDLGTEMKKVSLSISENSIISSKLTLSSKNWNGDFIVAKIGEGAQYITSKAWARGAREKIPNCLSANPMLC